MKTAISIVLDRSGSMGSCRQSTIDAVNGYLNEARNDSDLKESDLHLTIFDSESIDTIRSGKPVDITDITPEDFVPRASTPLYDAVGRGVHDLDARATDGKGVLVIVTDGYENASRKHSHESIKAMLDDRQAKGWLVVFLAAGLGAARQGLSMGVAGARVANIGLDKVSLAATMCSVGNMSKGYASTRSMAEAAAYSANVSFSAADRKAMGDASAGAGLVTGTKSGKAYSAGTTAKPDADAWASTAAPSGDAWGA